MASFANWHDFSLLALPATFCYQWRAGSPCPALFVFHEVFHARSQYHEPPPAGGGQAHRGAAPGAGRRRLRQDPGDHLPDRLPPPPPAGAGGEHPGGHLHQQGGPRDAGADGRAGREEALRRGDPLHLPLPRRADPPPGDRPARLQAELRHLFQPPTSWG